MSRTLPCACGGWLTADTEEPTRGVQRHQGEPRHVEWRAWREAEEPLPDVSGWLTVRDVMAELFPGRR